MLQVNGKVAKQDSKWRLWGQTYIYIANTSGHSRTTTLTILSHGASYHLTLLTTAPVKGATSA